MDTCLLQKDSLHLLENTEAVIWFHEVVSPLTSKPSIQLERFLSAKTENVIERVHIILEAIIPCVALKERLKTDNIWANKRIIDAKKLYFRVLEAMCTAEAQSLHADKLEALLSNECFHRCMLACSAEVVMKTYKTDSLLFPLLLTRTGITAFDLIKVIEIFIRHEESLPRELREHLYVLEAKMLESTVWERGSSMYESLNFARPDLSSEISDQWLLPEPLPSLDEIAKMNKIYVRYFYLQSDEDEEFCAPEEYNSLTSPVKDVLQDNDDYVWEVKNFNTISSSAPLQSPFCRPNRQPTPGGVGETCAETVISVFFSKVGGEFNSFLQVRPTFA